MKWKYTIECGYCKYTYKSDSPSLIDASKQRHRDYHYPYVVLDHDLQPTGENLNDLFPVIPPVGSEPNLT